MLSFILCGVMPHELSYRNCPKELRNDLNKAYPCQQLGFRRIISHIVYRYPIPIKRCESVVTVPSPGPRAGRISLLGRVRTRRRAQRVFAPGRCSARCAVRPRPPPADVYRDRPVGRGTPGGKRLAAAS